MSLSPQTAAESLILVGAHVNGRRPDYDEVRGIASLLREFGGIGTEMDTPYRSGRPAQPFVVSSPQSCARLQAAVPGTATGEFELRVSSIASKGFHAPALRLHPSLCVKRVRIPAPSRAATHARVISGLMFQGKTCNSGSHMDSRVSRAFSASPGASRESEGFARIAVTDHFCAGKIRSQASFPAVGRSQAHRSNAVLLMQ